MGSDLLEKDFDRKTLVSSQESHGDCRSIIYMYALSITISLGACNFGYSTGVFNEMQTFMAAMLNWNSAETKFYDAIISSALCGGGIFGVIYTWFSADFSGRKTNMLVTDIIYFIGGAFTMYSSEWSLILGRFLVGFAAGISTIMTPIFLREIAPNDIRGKICGVNEIFIGFGLLVSYVMAIGLPVPAAGDIFSQEQLSSNWWRIMFGITFILSFLRIFLIYLVFKIESPFYLYLQGNEPEARKQLKKLVREDLVDDYMDQMRFEGDNYKDDTTISFKTLFGPQYRYALTLCMSLVVIQQLCGIDSIVFYSEKMFNGNYSKVMARSLEILWAVLKLSTAIVSSLIVDRVGRRPLFLIGTSFLTLTLLCLFYVTKYEMDTAKPVFLYLYIISFSFSLGPLVWIFVPETLPERGVTVSVLGHWITSFLVVLSYPYLVGDVFGNHENDISGEANVYLLFMNFCILGLIIVVKWLPETARRSRQSIYRLMHTSSFTMSNYNDQILKEGHK